MLHLNDPELFEFKQFTVKHTNSTMKVGSDAVLLGAFARVYGDETLLDVGTGCGVIALMVCQKNPQAKVTAVDIDRESVMEASYNFMRSPWPGSLNAVQSPIQQFTEETTDKFDHIISNPPFFSGDKHSIFPSKTKARHTVYLDHWGFLNACDRVLGRNGKISVILPVLIAVEFIQKAAILNLELHRLLKVRPKPNTPHNRYLMEFSKTRGNCIENELLMYDFDSNYTEQYKSFTRDFYIDL
jgi:tRNA1Val (adenine37-N6)-methyltransferase